MSKTGQSHTSLLYKIVWLFGCYFASYFSNKCCYRFGNLVRVKRGGQQKSQNERPSNTKKTYLSIICFPRAPNGFNPAGSLITVCPCGCGKEDHSGENSSSGCSSLPSPPSTCNYNLPDSPELSPVKPHYGFYATPSDCSTGSSPSLFLDDTPLDMSKTSPMYGVKEENDRDKFSCLYLLVDAAVNQLEEIAAKKRRLNH